MTLNDLKQNIASVIAKMKANLTGKGVAVDESDTLHTLADKVNEIQYGQEGVVDAALRENGFDFAQNTILNDIQISMQESEQIKDYIGCRENSKIVYIGRKKLDNAINAYAWFRKCFSLSYIEPIDFSTVSSFFNELKETFYECFSLKEIELLNLPDRVYKLEGCFERCYSLRSIKGLDGVKVLNCKNAFVSCSNLKSTPLLDFSQMELANAMINASGITTIKNLNFSNITESLVKFGESYSKVKLENVNFIGEIICNFYCFSDNLTYESMIDMVNHLKDYSGGSTHTLQVGSISLGKLSDTEKVIAINKNWTLS